MREDLWGARRPGIAPTPPDAVARRARPAWPTPCHGPQGRLASHRAEIAVEIEGFRPTRADRPTVFTYALAEGTQECRGTRHAPTSWQRSPTVSRCTACWRPSHPSRSTRSCAPRAAWSSASGCYRHARPSTTCWRWACSPRSPTRGSRDGCSTRPPGPIAPLTPRATLLPSKAAIYKARARLGWEPVRALVTGGRGDPPLGLRPCRLRGPARRRSELGQLRVGGQRGQRPPRSATARRMATRASASRRWFWRATGPWSRRRSARRPEQPPRRPTRSGTRWIATCCAWPWWTKRS